MASKLAVCTAGYEDERFEQIVSHTFHCIICTNVINDAVTCSQNEHLFCRGCITRHLMYSQTCPTCMEQLTVDTLSEASRGVKSLLAELKIRCDFFDRGCGKFVELGDLKSHAANCGFAPTVCPNEGCNLEVNKQDLQHHETSVCELRRAKCHNCEEIIKEMDTVKQNLATMNKKLEKLENIETKEQNVENIVKLVQEQLYIQKESINRLEAGNFELKKSLNKIEKLVEKAIQEKSPKPEMVDRDIILPVPLLPSPDTEIFPRHKDHPLHLKDDIFEPICCERPIITSNLQRPKEFTASDVAVTLCIPEPQQAVSPFGEDDKRLLGRTRACFATPSLRQETKSKKKGKPSIFK